MSFVAKQCEFKKRISMVFCFIGCFLVVTMTSYAKEAPHVVLLNNELVLKTNMEKREVPQKWNGDVRKIVYLTFDDGPSKRSLDFIKILQEYDVLATFFYIGTNIERFSETVQSVYDAGFYIGLHTMTHDRQIIYNKENPNALIQELIEEQTLLESVIGERPTLFRPPYGSVPGINEEMANLLAENGYKIWDWTIDSKDWKQKSGEAILETIKQQTNAPIEIVLMHEKEQTLEALPSIIEFFKEQGYEFRMYQQNHHLVHNFLKDPRL